MATLNGQVDIDRTGEGTLAGRYMRMFWQPVYVGSDLKAGEVKLLRIMNQEITLFRGESGGVHALAPRCAHRLTYLYTGTVEGDCVRCFYHGWRYDASGLCVEAPAEREGFAQSVSVDSYPAEEYLGLIFVYLGEAPVPPLPRFRQLEVANGILSPHIGKRACNYFNNLENSLDPVHVPFVHRNSFADYMNQIPEVDAEETDYGIYRTGRQPDGLVRSAHIYMPNILQISTVSRDGYRSDGLHWRVPIDDESHLIPVATVVQVPPDKVEQFTRRREESRRRLESLQPEGEVVEAILRGEMRLEDVKDRPDIVSIQDGVAQIGQGRILDRTDERLGRSDKAVALLRRLWERELQSLAAGKELTQWNYPETGLLAEPGAPVVR